MTSLKLRKNDYNLIFKEIIIEGLIENLNLESLSISSFKQKLPHLKEYNEKQRILLKLIKAEHLNEDNHRFYREKLVS